MGWVVIEDCMLAAAVCAALLDTYEMTLRNSTSSKGVISSTESNRGIKRSFERSVTKDAERMDDCTKVLQDGSNEQATIVRMLEELPRFANLVTQYTRRYSRDVDKCPRDLPQALTASITFRLKSMIDEVARI